MLTDNLSSILLLIIIHPDQGYSLLDLDDNGTDDFLLQKYIPNYFGPLYINPLTASNDVLGSGDNSFAFPYALYSDDTISSGVDTWLNTGFDPIGYQVLTSNDYVSCFWGNWCDVTDRYLGLRFNISGSTHYGWVRMSVTFFAYGGIVWHIKDMAYHDTAGFPINAGQQTLSLDTNVLNKIKIVALNKSIGLYNLPEATNYKLFSITGKQVLNGTTFGNSFVVEASSISNGVYIIELTEANSKAVIRKKLVL